MVSPKDLTADSLLNASYTVQGLDGTWQTYTLYNGEFRSNSDPTSLDNIYINVSNTMGFGDLNGDGAKDAAVILAVNRGGSGVFVSVVAMLNQRGNPVYASSYYIDDRPGVDQISISDQEIHMDVLVHGPSDPMCCPSLPTKQTYRLMSGQLVLVNFISNPGNLERVITITSPEDGALVFGSFTVSGNVSVSPFENTLVYRIVLPDGTPVNQSSLMVDAPDMGAPGTFTLPLDLTAAGIRGPIRIDVYESSPADGSLLALDSVNLYIP